MKLETIFGKKGRLKSIVQGFELRDGQKAMAEAVALSLSKDQFDTVDQRSNILVVEAETGIGKTFAYLVPAVLSGKRIVVSTATLTLQDQVLEKDIPVVESITDQSISVTCVKGRENYICLYRWYQFRSNPQLSLLDNPELEKIDQWLKQTFTGDRSELGWLGKQSPLWNKISAKATSCLGGECPEGAGCFITRLRQQAGSAQLLIVNHHLFFSDLALKKGGYGDILPRYEAVIFDEAHHIENVASSFFGRSISQYQFFDLHTDIEQQARLDLTDEATDEIMDGLTEQRDMVDSLVNLFPETRGRFHLQPFIDELGRDRWSEAVENISGSLIGLERKVKKNNAFSENWTVLGKRARELSDTLCEIAGERVEDDTAEDDYVCWYDQKERALVLSKTPVEVASLLEEQLYSEVETCILTSATLSTGNSFSYVQKRLGLDDTVTFHQFSSPFNYQERTLLYIPDISFPEPSDNGYQEVLREQVLELLFASQGRALVLCTSLRGMDDIANYLEDNLDYPVYVQGSHSRNALLKKFRTETHSVLVAVASFWEGVDIAGESLSCVVIDKLPFEVPSDPVLQARIEKIKKSGGNPFFSFQVPRAVLTLRQGVGRLMRTATDSGVVAIMDVRLFKKGYGKTFLKSLPPAPLTRDLKEVEKFFFSLSDSD